MSILSLPVLPVKREVPQGVFGLPPPELHTMGLPVANSTQSLWINSPGANPLAKEGSVEDLTHDADICIIGSGITGVSAAYHLAEHFGKKENNGPSLKAVILEARDFCSGATGRNGGHLTSVPRFVGFSSREKKYGAEEAKKSYTLQQYTAAELVKIIKAQNWQDSVDLVSSHRIILLTTEQEFQDSKADYEAALAAGMDLDDVEWLSKEAVQATYGSAFPAFQYPGNNIWPLKLVTHMYNHSRNTNASKFDLSLHTNTPVTSISASPSGSRRWILSTPRGDIRCSYIIHATNGYASHLLPQFHGPAGIVPTRGQVITMRAAASAEEITPASWGGNRGYEYWFPRPVKAPGVNPLVILGGGRDASGPGFEAYVTDDSTVNTEVGKALRAFLPDLFPGRYEKGREPEMEWTGIMGYTKSGDPFVGPIVSVDKAESKASKGQYISAGYTGSGMARAFTCAEAVVGMIVADMEGNDWVAPEWLPRHFLTTHPNADLS